LDCQIATSLAFIVNLYLNGFCSKLLINLNFMADVTFLQNGQSTTVQASDDGSQSILDIALKNGINMDHACGGNGVCTTCMCRVHSGQENLSAVTDNEEMMGMSDGETRLGCQAKISGDITIEPAF
jgi:ferredoxin